jgi:dihydrofolate reductase
VLAAGLGTQGAHHPHRGGLLLLAVAARGRLARRLLLGHGSILVSKLRSLHWTQGGSKGGTTFHFVTVGFAAAHEQARAVAGDGDIDIAGGASAVQQGFRAGLLDELMLDIVPVVLGAGERLVEDVGDPVLTPVEVIDSPHATHVRYRVGRG